MSSTQTNPHHEPPTLAFRLLALLSRPLVQGFFRARASGVEHLPEGGFVLCANHLSGWDPWALCHPLYPRQPRFLVKAELFASPFVPLLQALGMFPVSSGDSVAAAVRHVTAGRIVLVFPEGARRRNRVLRPRSGGARIALGAGAPLVPAAVHGTEQVSPLTPWRVAFGPPVPLDDLASIPVTVAAREATRRVWEQVLALESTLS
ncbi:MAG TPA: lysophospholipid acyltransferase family protein [Gaiellaceae bacterium]|nr:lysophospholipid acyltransferase family protein [Gaiellaceae bacterium]